MAYKVVIDAKMSKRTLATVIERIENDGAIALSRRKSTVSLLRAGARFLGKAPEQLAFDGTLLGKLEKVAPRRHKVGKEYLQNVRTAYRFALKHEGVEHVPGRDTSPPSPAWQEKLAYLADNPEKSTLARTARWLTRCGVEPRDVTLADIERFRLALVAGDARGSAKDTWARLKRGWPRAVAAVPGWPRVEIPVERWPNRWTKKIEELPTELREEIEAFLAWARGEDEISKRLGVFGGRRRRKARRPATVEYYKYQLRAFVTAAEEAGIGSDRLTSLRALLEEDVIEASIQRLYERSTTQSDDRPHKILNMLKVIGRDFLKLDDSVIRPIAEACRDLRPEQKGMHPKNIERLAPLLSDPRLRQQFFDLPERLMRHAIAMDELTGGRQPAVIAQYAVALELWQTVPVRIGNMVGLELDRHFSTLAIREGRALIVIPGAEMKNGKPQTYPVMKRSCPRLRTYLDRFRPRLQGVDNPWLFPGRNGRHKHVVLLSGQISKLIKDELGLDFHPHLFRHLAGELYLTAYEGDYEGVANLLGHEGTATARLYYTTPRVRAAVERMDKVVLRLGTRLPAPAKGRQRR